MKALRKKKPQVAVNKAAAVFEEICLLIEGGMSLAKAAPACGTNPEKINRMCDKSAQKARRYACAKIVRAEYLAETIFDKIEECDSARGRHVDKLRIEIDARKWYLSKVLPKVYGDKLSIDATHEVKVCRLPAVGDVLTLEQIKARIPLAIAGPID